MPQNTASPPQACHCLIAGAGFAGATVQAPQLPQLARLLPRLRLAAQGQVPEDSPALPHELARADALGLTHLPPDRLPWAAIDTGTVDTPCAWLTLTHWQLGLHSAQVLSPDQLALTVGEAAELFQPLAHWLAQDGLTLHAATPQLTVPAPPPGTWLLTGDALRDLPTVSLARVVSQPLSRQQLQPQSWPTSLQRLMNELQMLLYQQPVTDARIAARQTAPNAAWLHGAGVLPQPLIDHASGQTPHHHEAPPAPPPLVLENRLLPAALRRDAAAHAAAWQALDAQRIAQLNTALDTGQPVQLTLAGTRRWLRLQSPAAAPAARWWNRIRRPRAAAAPALALDLL